MDTMEITCLDSTVSCQIEHLQRELAKLECSEKILAEELSQEQARLAVNKKRCDDFVAKIALKKVSLTEEKKQMEDSVMSDISRQQHDLNSQISLMEAKLQQLKSQREMELMKLRQSVEEFEAQHDDGDDDDSTLDAHSLQLMEEEDKLKEESMKLSKEIEERDLVLSELQKKMRCAEESLAQGKSQSSHQQQVLKERQHLLQDAERERDRLQGLLRQPQKDLNKQGSLYNEVTDEVSTIANKYENLKKKYFKSKQMLSDNNAEISKLKAESLKYKNFEERMKSERTQLAKEMNLRLIKRKQDLVYDIEFLKKKADDSKKIEPVVINSRNLSLLNIYAKTAQDEAERADKELVGISMNRIQMEQRLYKVNGELARTKHQLQQKLEFNQQLELQIKAFQEKEPSSDPPAEPTRKIRFADEIKDMQA